MKSFDIYILSPLNFFTEKSKFDLLPKQLEPSANYYKNWIIMSFYNYIIPGYTWE